MGFGGIESYVVRVEEAANTFGDVGHFLVGSSGDGGVIHEEESWGGTFVMCVGQGDASAREVVVAGMRSIVERLVGARGFGDSVGR